MSFPLYYLLIMYLVFLVVWLIFSLVAVYHILKFGFKNITTLFIVIFYSVIAAAIILLSFAYLIQIDWSFRVEIFGNLLDLNNFF